MDISKVNKNHSTLLHNKKEKDLNLTLKEVASARKNSKINIDTIRYYFPSKLREDFLKLSTTETEVFNILVVKRKPNMVLHEH